VTLPALMSGAVGDHIGEPHIITVLLVWMVLAYVLGGAGASLAPGLGVFLVK
jgi:hypothetical protein